MSFGKMVSGNYLFILIVISVFAGYICDDDNPQEEVAISVPEINEEPTELDNQSETKNLSLCSSRKSSNSEVRELTEVTNQEYPFSVAILNHEKEFICSGSVVWNGIILTAAHCLQPAPGYVMLNSIRVPSGKSEPAIYVNVLGSELFPTYSKSAAGRTTNDVGIIITEKFNKSVASKIAIKRFENSKDIADFTAIGYGLNAELGSPKPLQQVVLNHRYMYDLDETLAGYIDCIDTNISTCFKDTGGAAVFADELIGVVVTGQDECTKEMTSEYAINKLMVRVLPSYVFKKWLEDRIEAQNKTKEEVIAVHPMKPVSLGNIPKPERRANWQHSSKLLRQQFSHSNSLKGANMIILTTIMSCFFVLTMS